MSVELMAAAAGQAAPAAPPAAPATPAPAPAGSSVDPAIPAAQGESAPAFDPAALAYGTQLPKRLQSPEVFAKLTAPGAKLEHLVDGYLSAQEKLTLMESRIAIPGKDADPKEWDPVWKALGRPDTPAGYQLTRDGDLKGLPVFPGVDEFTAEQYHRHNLPKEVAESLWKENAKKSLEIMAAVKAQREADAAQGLKDLEALWGRDYAAKRAELEQVAVKFFGETEWKALNESPLANNAKFLDKLAGLQKYMSDSQIITGASATGKTQLVTVRDHLKEALKAT